MPGGNHGQHASHGTDGNRQDLGGSKEHHHGHDEQSLDGMLAAREWHAAIKNQHVGLLDLGEGVGRIAEFLGG